MIMIISNVMIARGILKLENLECIGQLLPVSLAQQVCCIYDLSFLRSTRRINSAKCSYEKFSVLLCLSLFDRLGILEDSSHSLLSSSEKLCKVFYMVLPASLASFSSSSRRDFRLEACLDLSTFLVFFCSRLSHLFCMFFTFCQFQSHDPTDRDNCTWQLP